MSLHCGHLSQQRVFLMYCSAMQLPISERRMSFSCMSWLGHAARINLLSIRDISTVLSSAQTVRSEKMSRIAGHASCTEYRMHTHTYIHTYMHGSSREWIKEAAHEALLVRRPHASIARTTTSRTAQEQGHLPTSFARDLTTSSSSLLTCSSAPG